MKKLRKTESIGWKGENLFAYDVSTCNVVEGGTAFCLVSQFSCAKVEKIRFCLVGFTIVTSASSVVGGGMN